MDVEASSVLTLCFFQPLDAQDSHFPDVSATYELFDRVVNVHQCFTVPLGLRGTVVGIHPGQRGVSMELRKGGGVGVDDGNALLVAEIYKNLTVHHCHIFCAVEFHTFIHNNRHLVTDIDTDMF